MERRTDLKDKNKTIKRNIKKKEKNQKKCKIYEGLERKQ